jgi:hypothetical protein
MGTDQFAGPIGANPLHPRGMTPLSRGLPTTRVFRADVAGGILMLKGMLRRECRLNAICPLCQQEVRVCVSICCR